MKQNNFLKLQEFLNRSCSYHMFDEKIYSEAQRLLEDVRSNKEFMKYVNPANSREDVQKMFEGLVDEWIDAHFIDIKEDGSWNCEMYNVLTDQKINKLLKEDIFNLIYNV